MNKNFLKGSLALSLAAAIWGGMYVVSKIILGYIQPWLLLEMRFIISLFVLGFITWWKGLWKIQRQDVFKMAMIGLVGYTGSIGMQFVGTDLSSAAMGSLITAASPALISIFAFYILKERLHINKITALILATIGVLCVIGFPSTNNQTESMYLGNIILFGAAITWAIYTVLSKVQTQKYSSLTVTTWSNLFGVIFTIPIVIWEQEVTPTDLPEDVWIWLGVLYLGIISTAVAFYFWNKGFEYLNASTGSLFFFLQPVVGSLLGFLLLDESLGITFLLGACLIGIGVYLSSKEKKILLSENKGVSNK
ncbi:MULTISPECIES: DMT family transporter [unclassified Bacillus (in: firmicutes)]|uniref:DMT family transporter n=1 Tax=unclassified Bacillus (in: firmicutes) TaxID=185979 RepID=UPI0008E13DD2|nr:MULTISPECIES: DMT family transporter [unclassified Bacillus (in: firmicutes)]SFI09609.1 Permease of the drug/metabolite transporter (DMT) superfamily [Bacillus sp. 71mf]SFS76910.1 Permease of the drug/metabolite transporter (DMT) superfamily [Bacillus sp. 103mf]